MRLKKSPKYSIMMGAYMCTEANKMRIALVDDEREQLASLSALLRQALMNHGIQDGEVACFSCGEELLSAWQPGQFDMIMLDIYMSGMSGVELAQRIRACDHQAALVFCTSSNDFASESYEVQAAYYLCKPITTEKLETMLRRIDLNRLEKCRSIQLPDGYRLLLRKLIYTNYLNHTVTFYMQDTPSHVLYISQTEVAHLLSDPCFYAANKGNIVNFHMVRKVADDCFIMKDDTAVPIARRRYKEAKEAFTLFHFQKLSEEAAR